MKNLHILHPEDTLWFGSDAALRTVALFKSILNDDFGNFCITEKWDGAPAIVCGINPENKKFFVGTKAVFNKTAPKINYTDEDINRNHEDPALRAKLGQCLKWLPVLGIRGVLQGDLLIHNTGKAPCTRIEEINGAQYLTFQPNTLKYGVPLTDAASRAEQVLCSRLGIVFHTSYHGVRLPDMEARFASPDLQCIESTDDVLAHSAARWEYSPSFTGEQRKKLHGVLQCATGLLSGNVIALIDEISRVTTLREAMKSFMVQESRLPNNDNPFAYVHRLRSFSMTPKAQAVLSRYESYTLHVVLRCADWLSQIGSMIREALPQTNAYYDMFLNGEKTGPEGYVAVDLINNHAVKLVDRTKFSKANLNGASAWKKNE